MPGDFLVRPESGRLAYIGVGLVLDTDERLGLQPTRACFGSFRSRRNAQHRIERALKTDGRVRVRDVFFTDVAVQ